MLDTLPRRADQRGRERRRGLVKLLALVLVLGMAGAPFAWFWRSIGASGPQRPVTFVVPAGATGSEVAEKLEEEGIIRSALAFRLLARVRGVPLSFEAGEFSLVTNMSAGDALDALRRGPAPLRGARVTFPEGLRVEQVAERAAEALGVRRGAFVRAARSGRFSLPPYLPEGAPTVEGFLFPSTYEFAEGATAEDVIRRLLDQFRREVRDLPWEQARVLGRTPYEIVIIASLIEREAKFDRERALISAVIHNRLKKGMPLQIDATVQYALGRWDPIRLEDRKVKSPYNTYRIPGLPPTPIANPGKASIAAALVPADVDYLYYVVVDSRGHHAFTADYDEFLRLQARYRG